MQRHGSSIVGLRWRAGFPDAASPAELWENVLAGRRSFRPMPPRAARLARDYAADAVGEADVDHAGPRRPARPTGSSTAAASGSGERPSRAADLDALAGARTWPPRRSSGIGGRDRLDAQRTGVVVGQHADRRVHPGRAAASALAVRRRRAGRGQRRRRTVGEARDPACGVASPSGLRSRFPDPQRGDSLAGGLSNTIAGRICNHFDSRAAATPSTAPAPRRCSRSPTPPTCWLSGDLDASLAGGVDLSLDPFELVGFRETARSPPTRCGCTTRAPTGFWPGEGCGIVVLMRERTRGRRHRRCSRRIRGWGISSDGARRPHPSRARGPARCACAAPTQRGRRSRRRSPYFEGHGTGTAVGDPIEVRALAALRGNAATGAADRLDQGEHRPHQGRRRRRRPDQGDRGVAARHRAAPCRLLTPTRSLPKSATAFVLR